MTPTGMFRIVTMDDHREQNSLDRELERDSEREMWEGNESDSDW
ncbi:hypothetical protein [Planktothrix agardhii]|jgi:hypothetical protein|nr:hypothetical protein [Planktothrix agardhii]CAD0225575.1 conserved hypothetical protein [Planktothrix agardhii]